MTNISETIAKNKAEVQKYKDAWLRRKEKGERLIEPFFADLERVLRKYFGEDWVFHYEDAYHPLTIYSESLAQSWESYMEEGSV